MNWIGRSGGLGVLVLGLLGSGPVRAAEREAWDAVYVGAEKVGHTHYKVGTVKDARGRDLYRVQVNQVLGFTRDNDRITMEVRYGTIETPEGAVLKLDTRLRAGQDELRTYGEVADGTMHLILEGNGQRRELPIRWGGDVRGPYGAELSLSRQPISPGQARDVQTFIPELNQICTTHLRAIAPEDVSLGGGVRRALLRIEQTVTGADGKPMPEMDTTLWADGSGQILKGHSALLGGMDFYRTTRDAALAPNGSFDLLRATVIKVPRSLPNPERTRVVVYRVSLTEGDIAATFPADQRQSVVPSSTPTTATLRVQSDSPTTGPTGPAAVADEFLRPNSLINSDDPEVIAHTRQAVGTRTDPWQRAVAIEDWVFNNMKKKNFSNAFASAKEVARNLEGDCSEHSVLTAAMCRAAGIPCRIVIGLVYAGPLDGFGPHAWDEVYIGGRWVAIDAAFNESEVDATHLKLATSSLDGVAPFEAFLPIMRIFNKLQIEPLEIR